MRKKKVYVNIGEAAHITVVFVPDEFTADAAGAREARDIGLTVPDKPVFVAQDHIAVMPIEQVVRMGQRPEPPTTEQEKRDE